MREVTKEEYLKAFMNFDSICTVDNSKGYPYIVYWTLRNRPDDIIAKKVPINKTNKYQYLIK